MPTVDMYISKLDVQDDKSHFIHIACLLIAIAHICKNNLFWTLFHDVDDYIQELISNYVVIHEHHQ